MGSNPIIKTKSGDGMEEIKLRSILKSNIIITKSTNHITIITRKEEFFNIIKYLKYGFHYNSIMDITATDFIIGRFELVYHLFNSSTFSRIRLKFLTNSITPIPSISSLFIGSIWWEREVWDMYGIYFYNNPDLRRILTDYGFNYYPLRKDFPLIGYKQYYYNDEFKAIQELNVELSQQWRNFKFFNSW